MRTPSHAHTAASSHGIDLAPMLDFAVNLLIFFIVTAVFAKQAGIDVGRPSGVEPTTDTPSKSFVIDAGGAISVDGKTIDIRVVRAHVEQFRAANRNGGNIAVIADPDAPMGVIIGVADEIRLGGIDDITFTTTVMPVPQ